MPTRVADNKFKCSICNKVYNRILYAQSCENAHQVMYVPLTKQEINRLIQFIYTKDDSIIQDTEIVKKLLKYTKIKE